MNFDLTVNQEAGSSIVLFTVVTTKTRVTQNEAHKSMFGNMKKEIGDSRVSSGQSERL